jgi:hypothetical protein
MCDTCDVTRAAATLGGYASVARASEVLHLAPRSVRDLIYAGRLPSLRVGRLHYIKASDLDLERRRRLHLPLPTRSPRTRNQATRSATASTDGSEPRSSPAQTHATEDQPAAPGLHDQPAAPALQRQHARPALQRQRVDTALRRERAAERAEMVSRWVQRHPGAHPRVPAVVLGVTTPVTCEVCGREIRRGRVVELSADDGRTAPSRLCVTCGRRALLDWADRRRQEAAAARQLSHSLGEPRVQLEDHASLVA